MLDRVARAWVNHALAPRTQEVCDRDPGVVHEGPDLPARETDEPVMIEEHDAAHGETVQRRDGPCLDYGGYER